MKKHYLILQDLLNQGEKEKVKLLEFATKIEKTPETIKIPIEYLNYFIIGKGI